ncbi:TerC family protein [Quadrisphaera sp. INWT6]|uniref:TerC family protein n=1 Tax=Quadrisphaera sp. INWT6 TaxID=2596917 RepID=UPI00189284C5|nr:TerC family protein [Quadrisphaera sp. INWT6]MBF5083541.1 TerC family protein [Quadrisphaera sp. INWT6]
MDVPLWVWGITLVGIVGMIVYDFVGHVRTPHAPSIREAAIWSAVYVGIAILFGVLVLVFAGPTYGGEYFAGYITEKALSVDNLFVFVLILSSFGVPREYQQKVLLIGIAIAIVLRGIFIAIGAAAIQNFSWIFWIFGAILIYTAIAQVKAQNDHGEEEFKENAVLRLCKRILPTTDDYHGDKFTTKIDGKRFVTPMLVVIIAIGTADLIFAVDSIPAIFGLTQETYLVFAANAFSLLGLRQLYFLIDGLLDRLVYLHYGLAAILAFIGAKLIIHAMHENELSWLNGGEHITVIPEIPMPVSLGFIVVALLLTTVLSLRKSKKDAEQGGGRGDVGSGSGPGGGTEPRDADVPVSGRAAQATTASSTGATRDTRKDG